MKEKLNKDGYEKNANVFEKLVINLELKNSKILVNTWYFDSCVTKHVYRNKFSYRGL
jgi:hypothetical protein